MEENLTRAFLPGDMAVLSITHKWSTSDGWAAGGTAGPQQLRLYQKIDLNSFPSHNDFIGHKRVFFCGEIVLIVGYVGRPMHCTHTKADSEYDVYEIFKEGRTYQALRWNLEKPEEIEEDLEGTKYADNLLSSWVSFTKPS